MSASGNWKFKHWLSVQVKVVLIPLPLSLTWGCQQVETLGLLFGFKNNKTKGPNRTVLRRNRIRTGQGSSLRRFISVISQMRYLIGFPRHALQAVVGSLVNDLKRGNLQPPFCKFFWIFFVHMAYLICLFFMLHDLVHLMEVSWVVWIRFKSIYDLPIAWQTNNQAHILRWLGLMKLFYLY
jgi:hypothetical protein